MARPGVAPVLSTPDTHIFDESGPLIDASSLRRLDDEQLDITYEIQRTGDEIRRGRWKRIALQFPDHMLIDAPRVFQALSRGLDRVRKDVDRSRAPEEPTIIDGSGFGAQLNDETRDEEEKLYILADTSYGACCVDEVAAEHANADVVVHYGRSCLSPTARLPVIYVFTKPPLDLGKMLEAFKETYKDRNENLILMADIPYNGYLSEFAELLGNEGYSDIFVTTLIHDTASPLPNRTVPMKVSKDIEALKSYRLFHVSEPPASLLLTLSSRVADIHLYPTNIDSPTADVKPLLANSTAALRRRYALLTRVSAAPIIGILINTLSVKSYLQMLTHLKRLIASAGKKAYTFVVGKVNAAKVANFSEVGGWVVIGCWESSLFDSTEFWKPVITPWELEVALQGDESRVWTGEWRSDFDGVLGQPPQHAHAGSNEATSETTNGRVKSVEMETSVNDRNEATMDDGDSEEESEAPEIDLRTGRFVSNSRPMRSRPAVQLDGSSNAPGNTSLIKRQIGELATIGGEISPAAEHFRHERSWQGLGSDFELEYDEEGALKPQEAAIIEMGRAGIARGYTVGDGSTEGQGR